MPAVRHRARARPNAASVVLFAALYFAIAALTVRYTRFEGGVACIWMVNAFMLSELTGRPRRDWPPYLVAGGVAGTAATALFGLGAAAAIPFGLVNIGESVAGALLIRRLLPRCCHFASLGEIGGFLAIIGLLVPSITGLFGAAVAWLVADVAYWPNWLNYFAAHALGAITFTPLLILIRNGDLSASVRTSTRREWLEAGSLVVVMALVTTGVFAQSRMPLLFLPFLPMMIGVFRLGRLGATVSIAILTTFATGFTVQGFGPANLLAGGTIIRAQFLQFYLATAVLVLLPAAAELKRRKALMTRLQDAGALHRLILDRTGDIVMRLDLDGTIRYISPSVLVLGGYNPADLVGRMPTDLIAAEDVAEVRRVHLQALASPNDTFIVEYRGRRADGELGWFETHTRATVDETGIATGAVSIVREVTRRKEVERILTHDASTDSLTGLANRRAFDRALNAELTGIQNGKVAGCLAMFDIDHFKSVNDRYGHATGDDVLKGFAEILKRALREADTVARFGGEEFVVIIKGADITNAHATCERIRATFAGSACQAEDGRVVRATVSAGIAQLAAGSTVDELLAAADAALYRAKTAGRNRLVLAA